VLGICLGVLFHPEADTALIDKWLAGAFQTFAGLLTLD